MQNMGVDVVGTNCSLGPDQMLPVVQELLGVCECPVMQRGVLIVPVNTLMQRVCPHSYLHGRFLILRLCALLNSVRYMWINKYA